MKRTIAFFLVLLLTLGVTASCKKKEEVAAPAAAPAPIRAEAPSQAKESEALPAPTKATQAKRKVILEHFLRIEVKSVPDSLDVLAALADKSGGYVFGRSRTGGDEVSGSIALRVPSGKAGSVLAEIRRVGRILSENSHADDITDSYVDLEARLGNEKASEQRLLGLYHQAGKLSDVLAVEKELTRVRGEIEAFEAKKRNWDLLTETTAIHIDLVPAAANLPTFHRLWRPISSSFRDAAVILADSIHGLIVFLGAAIPWLLVASVPIWIWRRKRRNKQVGSATSPVDSSR